MESQKIWSDILSDVKSQVSTSVFKTWFLGAKALTVKSDGGKKLLVVGVKNNFLKEHLERKFLPVISEIGKKKTNTDFEVIFVVTPHENGNTPNAPIFTGVAQSVLIKRRAEILNPNYTFENFVAGQSNNLCFLAAKSVAENIGSNYNPLFIYGPTGVGKTHLLHAIGNLFLQSTLDGKVLYVSSERFTNDYLESLMNKTQMSFRAKYRSLDLLLIDDIQFLSGKEGTQDEFFHTFNELVLSQRQVVIVSDKHPRELGRIKERLASRLLGGLSVDVGLPDLEMRMAILKLKCRGMGAFIDDETIKYIAQSCEGGARELEGSLINVLSRAKLSGRKVSVDEVKTFVEINEGGSLKRIDHGKIIESVCAQFGVKKADLSSKSRKARINSARQVAMYFLRQDAALSLGEIGEMMGGRDHSTVIHAVEKIQRLAKGQEFSDDLLRIKKLFKS